MADWKIERPDIASAPTQGGHSTMAALVRGGAPLLSAEGGVTGALLSGGAETIAELLEGQNPFNNIKRIGVEAGLGAVPMGKIIKAGKWAQSALKSGALSGAGEAMREGSKGEDFDAGKIAASTGIGAVTGGVGSKLMGLMGMGKWGNAAEEATGEAAETLPMGRSVTTTHKVTPDAQYAKPLTPIVTKDNKVNTSTNTTWPVTQRTPTTTAKPMAVGAPSPPKPSSPSNLTQVDSLTATKQGDVGAGSGLRINKAPGLATTGGKLVDEPEVYKTWAQAMGKAKKLGMPKESVVPTEGGFKIQGLAAKKPAVPNEGVASTPVQSGVNAAVRDMAADAPSVVKPPKAPEIRGFSGSPPAVDRADARMPAPPTKASAPIDLPVKANKTAADMKAAQGITAGNAPYEPGGTVASPVSGAMQAYPAGKREGYIFGQHSPSTVAKAERAGDMVAQPAREIGDETGAALPMAMLRLAGGGIGAAYGGATAEDGHRLENAAMYGALGAAAPSLPNVLKTLGAAPEALSKMTLGTTEGAREVAGKVMNTIPQVMRFNYLASTSGLPANALVGPYGAALMGAIEHSLSGDPRGMKALQVLKNPATFIEMFSDPKVQAEAQRLMTETSTMERADEDLAKNGIQAITSRLSFPGKLMTRGDIVARKILMDAGFNEDEARLITLTAEPLTKAGRGAAHFGQGSPLLQMMSPFRRTPANVGERGVERLPGFGLLPQVLRTSSGNEATAADSVRHMLVQQAMGTGVGAAGYGIGAHTDPESMRNTRKYLTNFSGMYSLPMALGLAAGQASQYGENPISTAGLTAVRDSLPLPTTEGIEELLKYLTEEGRPIPRALVPQDVADYLKER